MEKLLTVSEVADILGIKKQTAYALVCQKRLPCVKISGRILRFKQSDIEEWLQSKTQPAKTTEIRQQPVRYKLKKNTNFQNDYINSIVERAKREVGV